jgi:pyrimidine-specific ribonucleoside hydrolase
VAPERVVIDCDPGVDDAVAIMLALASSELSVCGITTVAGNVPLESTTRNALRVLELAQRTDVPVAPGCDRPLVGSATRVASSHGGDGLGDIGLPEAHALPVPSHAIDLLARLGEEQAFTLVATGPLTNVALLLARYPEAPRWIERVSVMGGSGMEGNVTPAAEFNIWSDPEAAARVFSAGLDLTIVPLDVTLQAYLDDDDLRALSTLPGRSAAAAAAMLETYRACYLDSCGSPHMPMHDALAVFEVIDPGAIVKSRARVHVDHGDGPRRGSTAIDRGQAPGQGGMVNVGHSLDRRAFVDLLLERLSSLP